MFFKDIYLTFYYIFIFYDFNSIHVETSKKNKCEPPLNLSLFLHLFISFLPSSGTVAIFPLKACTCSVRPGLEYAKQPGGVDPFQCLQAVAAATTAALPPPPRPLTFRKIYENFVPCGIGQTVYTWHVH
jgi:hypothetical protein